MLRIELRRGAAPLALVVLAVVGTVLQLSELPRFSEHSSWRNGWNGAAGYFNGVTVVLGPVAGTVAAWVGGRERRLRVEELLAVTSRPPWQRHTAALGAVLLATAGGMLTLVGLLVAAAAPGSAYVGQAPVLVALSVLGVLVCAAWGWAAGRVLRYRLTAPVVGLLLYAGNGAISYTSTAWHHLAPVANLDIGPDGRLLPGVAVLLAGWLGVVGAGAVVAAAARRRVWVLAPLVLALVACGGLSQVRNPSPSWTAWSGLDPRALEPVCTPDAPVVCVSAMHAGLLPAVTPLAREVLGDVAPLTGFTRVQESGRSSLPPDTLALAFLDLSGSMFSSDLARPDTVRQQTVGDLVVQQCGPEAYPDDVTDDPVWNLAALAAALLQPGGATTTAVVDGSSGAEVDVPAWGWLSPAQERTRDRLLADPAAARAWVQRYLAAARTCDLPELRALASS